MKRKLIGALVAAMALTIALTAPATASTEQTVPTPAAIDAYLAKVMESTGLPGMSVVVTHNDRVIHAAGFGQGSDGKPVTADTPMRVASLSKSFTAMAVMTLVDAGKIKLDEAVAQQLPGFQLADPRATALFFLPLTDFFPSSVGLFSLLAKHPQEDLIHVFQLPLQVECVFDLPPRDLPGNLRIAQHQLPEVESFVPGLHGVALHNPVGVLAHHTVLDQIEQ